MYVNIWFGLSLFDLCCDLYCCLVFFNIWLGLFPSQALCKGFGLLIFGLIFPFPGLFCDEYCCLVFFNIWLGLSNRELFATDPVV
jgi:hypothetical protein